MKQFTTIEKAKGEDLAVRASLYRAPELLDILRALLPQTSVNEERIEASLLLTEGQTQQEEDRHTPTNVPQEL